MPLLGLCNCNLECGAVPWTINNASNTPTVDVYKGGVMRRETPPVRYAT
ncbi:hypothetical protein A2U01_0020242, partial [Trifolium medium]|nr:hypothetical protein [Trifolium medium]